MVLEFTKFIKFAGWVAYILNHLAQYLAQMSASGTTEAMATILKIEEKIEGREAKIEGLEKKLERLEQSYPANERPAGLAVELEQYRKYMNTLQEELVELRKEKNILLGRAAAAQSQAASAGLVEAVQDMAATLKAYTAPTLKRPKLPSALSNISQTAWDYVQQDFELQMVGLQPNDLPDVKPAPDVPAYQWQDCREDDQKDAYMLYIRGIIPLDERTEWIQGDKHRTLLNASQVHRWPVGEAELYHLSGTTDAAAVLTAYMSMGLPWEGIRLTIEVKKQIVNKWHFEAAAQLICANITSSKFKPLAILTDLVDEWHLKYMSGHKLCAGRFPSRAAAVACIGDWLEKEKVIETAETDEPLQVAEASDPGVLSPILKRARYTYRLPVGGPGEEACLRDLADCLPKEEAYEVLCLAGIQDLMQHYPLSSALRCSMFS
ncbi:hypothetical protein QJQ45_014213 [Haematococcus lacustris]|nr:hypothetical protein QJQ45_014213 [Haematococcus lacustris]